MQLHALIPNQTMRKDKQHHDQSTQRNVSLHRLSYWTSIPSLSVFRPTLRSPAQRLKDSSVRVQLRRQNGVGPDSRGAYPNLVGSVLSNCRTMAFFESSARKTHPRMSYISQQQSGTISHHHHHQSSFDPHSALSHPSMQLGYILWRLPVLKGY